MIGAEQLSVGYGDRAVLRDVDLRIDGGLVALIGANGSGKSTLMRALAGLHPAMSGRVLGPGPLPPAARARQLNYLPQRGPDAPRLAVRQFIAMGADGASEWGVSEEAMDRVEAAMKGLGIERLAERRCDALSGGEFRRVQLAASIAQPSPWLLLDEPCAGLDLPQASAALAQLQREAKRRQGGGVLVVLHDLNMVAQYAERCLLLGDGKLLYDDETETVLNLDGLEAAYGGRIERFRHPKTGQTVVLGPRP